MNGVDAGQLPFKQRLADMLGAANNDGARRQRMQPVQRMAQDGHTTFTDLHDASELRALRREVQEVIDAPMGTLDNELQEVRLALEMLQARDPSADLFTLLGIDLNGYLTDCAAYGSRFVVKRLFNAIVLANYESLSGGAG